MQTKNKDGGIIEKIDSFIENCKSEILKRKSRLDGAERSKARRDENQNPDALQRYVHGGRFGFNQCVKDCIGINEVEAYKACRKRICNPRKVPSEEDFNKMEFLYREMQKKYRAEEFIVCPSIPKKFHQLPDTLVNMVSEASRHFDKSILDKDRYMPSEHFLLDQDCRHYLEAMLEAYDLMVLDLQDHISFIHYWFTCIRTKSKELNEQYLLSSAFSYFSKKLGHTKINPTIEKIAQEYLTELRRWHKEKGVEGHRVSDFIGEYQKPQPYAKIRTDGIKWFPWELDKKDEEECRKHIQFKLVARELEFAWSVARLWQLFRHRDESEASNQRTYLTYLRDFLGLSINANINKANTKISDGLAKSLENSNPENEDFLEENICRFDPAILTQEQMCNFFKKACKSSIHKQSPSTAETTVLKKFWLLGKFFNIHFYPLDFIKVGDGERGLPDRVVKQFDSIDDLSFLKSMSEKDILKLFRDLQKESGRKKWNTKQIPSEEIWVSLAGNDDDQNLREKSQHYLPGLEHNPYSKPLEKIGQRRTKGSILNQIDLVIRKSDSQKIKDAKRTIVKAASENPKKLIEIMIFLSAIDQSLKLFHRDSVRNNHKSSSPEDSSLDDFYEAFASLVTEDECVQLPMDEERKQGYDDYFIMNLVLSKFSIHEKNPTLITIEYIDNHLLDLINKILLAAGLTHLILTIVEVFSPKEVSKT